MTPGALPPHRWSLRYAPHLGYAPPFEPLFRETVGDDDPANHIAFAALQGFAGVVSPWIGSQSETEQQDLARNLRGHGLEAGCVVWAPLAEVANPVWVSDDQQTKAALLQQVRSACTLANTLGSKTVAILIAQDSERSSGAQLESLRDNLKLAADEAAARDVLLGIEPMVVLPDMLFRSTYEAADVIADVNHPALKLIFDTGHVNEMDGDVLYAQRQLKDLICLYQFADMPGRVEPGAGSIDFVELVRRLRVEGYSGLVELEHGWAAQDLAGEARGLAHLRAIDASSLFEYAS